MDYWDTSALAKLYVGESDSALFSARVTNSGPVTSSELTRWEIYRVFVRKEVEGQIPVGAAEALFDRFLAHVTAGTVTLLPMSAAIEERFRKLIQQLRGSNPPLLIRTLDGIHLATADTKHTMVATDGNLRKCSAALGLQVFPV